MKDKYSVLLFFILVINFIIIIYYAIKFEIGIFTFMGIFNFIVNVISLIVGSAALLDIEV